MFLFKLLLGALFIRIVSSRELANNEICFSAVYRAYKPIKFAGPAGKKQWVMYCRNHLKVASIYASAKVYCQPEEILSGVGVLEENCQRRISQPLLPMSDFAANLTDETIAKMKVIENGEISPEKKVNTPVLISKKFFDLSLKTVVWKPLTQKV